MDEMNDYTIYQQQYLDAIKEEYEEPLGRMIDTNENFIHPSAIVGSNVKLGKNNYIGANCYIVGDVTIGNNNHFEAFCSVGTFPEHRSFFNNKKMKGVVIFDNNVFREFTTINSGCYANTVIGNHNWMLRGSHVGHDVLVGNNVTLSCNALIGGHSIIGNYVNFGLGAICHQFSVIGAGAMIGMGAIVTKTTPILPFYTYVGNPCKKLKPNDYRLKQMSEEEIVVYNRLHESNIKHLEEIKKLISENKL